MPAAAASAPAAAASVATASAPAAAAAAAAAPVFTHVLLDASGLYLGLFDASKGSPPAGARPLADAHELAYLQAERPGAVHWDGHAWAVAPLPPPPPVPLPRQLAVIEAQKESAGVWFQPSGQSAPLLFATDEEAQKRMTRLAELITLDGTAWPANGTWSTAAGVPLPFTSADVIGLGKAIGRYVMACTLNAVRLGALIGAGQKPDLTQGWPSQGTPPPPPAA